MATNTKTWSKPYILTAPSGRQTPCMAEVTLLGNGQTLVVVHEPAVIEGPSISSHAAGLLKAIYKDNGNIGLNFIYVEHIQPRKGSGRDGVTLPESWWIINFKSKVHGPAMSGTLYAFPRRMERDDWEELGLPVPAGEK